MPRRGIGLWVPANNYWAHSIRDHVTRTVLKFHAQTICLPVPVQHPASGSSPTLLLTVAVALRAKRYVRGDASDTASHLVNALRQQVRNASGLIPLNLRERDSRSSVVNRLYLTHLRVKTTVVIYSLPVKV